ncbi:Ethanolamine-phosphate cytidylyltransferase [Rhizoclosmatium sp. JEL0117]|nr:Ethanolamine-phosphate cytidylyltransferase [Rhizoclosmatium sp. JEL0117]
MGDDLRQKPKSELRIWVDGCFDMMHFGHANALRQAKEMGGYLVVGVHSDAEILKNKGPTVMTEQERYAAVAACKWVDEVVPNAPYLTSLEWMDKYGCQICAHGDDVTTMADGSDCYQLVKDAGRYWEYKRTQGVSTTELVGRMLLGTNELKDTPAASTSPFLPTSQKLIQFSSARDPLPGEKVVYVHGGFDLFHVGHIEFLKAAKALGSYLIVGIHDDATVNKKLGGSYPIMTVQERALSVLQCRYVDEVIIGAPAVITKDVLEKVWTVDVVVGKKGEKVNDDVYELPKSLGIYTEVEPEFSDMTTVTVIDRIIANRQLYEARQAKKLGKAVVEERMLEEQKRQQNK